MSLAKKAVLELIRKFEPSEESLSFQKYQSDPIGYITEVLGVTLTPQQVEIAHALLEHPRVAVKSGHGVGKDFIAAALINWHYDSFNPSITISTAPTEKQLCDVLWSEVRKLRRNAPLLKGRGLMPKAPRIDDGESGHYAVGYTASDAAPFQGRHEERVFIVFDEAEGIDKEFFEAAESMLTSENCKFLCLYNPLDTSCAMFEEEMKNKFYVVSLSCLDHPNIQAELENKKPPFPKAVRLAFIEEKLQAWCEEIPNPDTPTDFIWKEKAYRPNPLFEARVLGRWPTQSTESVWSEADFQRACEETYEKENLFTEIGCDVARFGDDRTVIIARRGKTVIYHESFSKISTDQIAGRLKRLCQELALPYEEPTKIPVKIDDVGVGGGVVDQRENYNFIGINAGEKAVDETKYANRRSELWFATKEQEPNFSKLKKEKPDALYELRRQLMSVKYKYDSKGRKVIEPKEHLKKRLGYSPDDADALNLAFASFIKGTLIRTKTGTPVTKMDW